MEQILHPDTVALDESGHAIVIIDQTLLPASLTLISLKTREEFFDAIATLKVRGAPAIGVTAAMAYYLMAWRHVADCPGIPFSELSSRLEEDRAYLAKSRPTAVNLFWALDRMKQVLQHCSPFSGSEILERLRSECLAIRDEDIRVCRAIGEHGLALLHPGDGVLTHCNAGRLATVRYGTALAPVYLAEERGFSLKVYSDETRPLLQGARLTCTELSASGVDVTLLCDGMSGSLMRSGAVQIIFVGADRIAANGDVVNKIGTSVLACAAKRYGIPFYVCAPTSTIDMDCPTGSEIPIEQRAPEEVTSLWYEKRMAPEGIGVYNPAFDITDSDLITGVITENGILRPPFAEGLAKLFVEKRKQ